VTDAAIRELVDRALRQHSADAGTVESVMSEVFAAAQWQKIPVGPAFWRVVLEYWWTLARSGAVALSGGPAPSVPHFPHFVVTDLGRWMLQETTASPHDWAKYEAAVRIKVGEPDPVVSVHLGESVRAFNASLYRSSAVMLGCAVEQLIILLAEAIVVARLPAPADKLRGKLESSGVGISAIYDDVRTVLGHATDDGKLPRELADVLDRRLTSLFDHARVLRNKSGHPTGEEVTADEALSGLLLFPDFYEFVDKLIAVMRALAPAGGGS
jgi:hypothetical protein